MQIILKECQLHATLCGFTQPGFESDSATRQAVNTMNGMRSVQRTLPWLFCNNVLQRTTVGEVIEICRSFMHRTLKATAFYDVDFLPSLMYRRDGDPIDEETERELQQRAEERRRQLRAMLQPSLPSSDIVHLISSFLSCYDGVDQELGVETCVCLN